MCLGDAGSAVLGGGQNGGKSVLQHPLALEGCWGRHSAYLCISMQKPFASTEKANNSPRGKTLKSLIYKDASVE